MSRVGGSGADVAPERDGGPAGRALRQAQHGQPVADIGRHLMALVEYDGTGYHGFQIQANVPTVQEALEQALAQITQEHIPIRFSGRTDAGVHARGQVVDLWTTWERSVDELHRAWNAVLPPDVAVRELLPAPEGFHPRNSARSRIYRYHIWNHPVRSPLHRRTHCHVARQLDEAQMAAAAQVLVGEHDFRTFGAPTQPGGPTVRVVERIEVWREDSEVFVEIEANAFLRRMVRRVTAALIDVGQGRLSLEELAAALTAADPAQLQGSAPGQGLCLIKVRY